MPVRGGGGGDLQTWIYIYTHFFLQKMYAGSTKKFREKVEKEGATSLAELLSINLPHHIELWNQEKGKDE